MPRDSLKFITKANGVHKRNYSFKMNVVEEIFEIRSCIEILANDIKSTQLISICSTVNYKVYILRDLHPLRGMSGLNMYDLLLRRL